MNRTALQQAVQSLLPLLDAETVLSRIGYRTDSVLQSGIMLRTLCPIHRESLIRSLTIDTAQRSFRCGFSRCPGARGGNLFELYSLATGKDAAESLKDWHGFLGIPMVVIEEGAAQDDAPRSPKASKEAPAHRGPSMPGDAAPGAASLAAESPVDPAEPAEPPENAEISEVPEGRDAIEPPVVIMRELDAEGAGDDERGSGGTVIESDAGATPAIDPGAGDEEAEERPPRAPVAFEPAPSLILSEFSPEMSGLSDAIADLDDAVSASESATVLSAMTGSFAETLSNALAKLEAGQVDEALELGADCFRLAVTDVERARAHLVMGRAQHLAHRHAQALRELRSGLEPVTLPPDVERELRYHLALVLEARKDFRSAFQTLKRVVEEQGHFRDTDAVLRRLEKASDNLPSSSGRKRIAFV